MSPSWCLHHDGRPPLGLRALGESQCPRLESWLLAESACRHNVPALAATVALAEPHGTNKVLVKSNPTTNTTATGTNQQTTKIRICIVNDDWSNKISPYIQTTDTLTFSTWMTPSVGDSLGAATNQARRISCYDIGNASIGTVKYHATSSFPFFNSWTPPVSWISLCTLMVVITIWTMQFYSLMTVWMYSYICWIFSNVFVRFCFIYLLNIAHIIIWMY